MGLMTTFAEEWQGKMNPVMNQQQASRCLTLAHFLRTQVTERQFNILDYVRGGHKELFNVDCGSSACALGWNTVVDPYYFKFDEFGGLFVRDTSGKWASVCSTGVIENYFGIPNREADSIFYGVKPVGPKAVAKMLERAVNRAGYEYA